MNENILQVSATGGMADLPANFPGEAKPGHDG